MNTKTSMPRSGITFLAWRLSDVARRFPHSMRRWVRQVIVLSLAPRAVSEEDETGIEIDNPGMPVPKKEEIRFHRGSKGRRRLYYLGIRQTAV